MSCSDSSSKWNERSGNWNWYFVFGNHQNWSTSTSRRNSPWRAIRYLGILGHKGPGQIVGRVVGILAVMLGFINNSSPKWSPVPNPAKSKHKHAKQNILFICYYCIMQFIRVYKNKIWQKSLQIIKIRLNKQCLLAHIIKLSMISIMNQAGYYFQVNLYRQATKLWKQDQYYIMDNMKKQHKTYQLKSYKQQRYAEKNQNRASNQSNGQCKRKIVLSEMFHTLYEPTMKQIQIQSQQRMYQQLKKHGISLCPQQFGRSFERICLKTNWQTTVYRLKLHRFQTQITILKLNASFKSFSPRAFAKGQFGQVSSFQHNNKQYAIKNIKIDPDKDDEFQASLKEVFMIKIASCLKVGPHLQNIFGYDAILFRDSLQIPMELCVTANQQRQIKSQLENRQLYKSLKKLHQLRICHCDIKFDNIGWSKTFKKFVFLDFGLSKFLPVPLGQKTNINFVGTYKYCSEQMKKIYLLRQRSYVDLYYNDLHCLNKTIQQMENQIRHEAASVHYQAQRYKQNLECNMLQQQNSYMLVMTEEQVSLGSQIQSYEQSFGDICSFYMLKYCLFNQKFSDLEEIINKQKNLVYSFRKILYQEIIQESNYKNYKQIVDAYQKYSQFYQVYQNSKRKIKKLDALIYVYIVKSCCSEPLYNNKQKLACLIQMDKTYDFIQQVWGQQKWMQQFFYFIDDRTHKQRIIYPQKRHLLINLFMFIRENYPLDNRSKLKRLPLKNSPVHISSMLHESLIIFFQYFYERKNILILEEILPYFIIFQDGYNLQIMQMMVLELYRPDEKKFIMKILQYLVGKFLGHRESLQFSYRMYQLVKQNHLIIKQQKREGQPGEMSQLYDLTLNFIKVFGTASSYDAFNFHKLKVTYEYIQSYLSNPITQYISPQIRYALQKITNQSANWKIKSLNLAQNTGYKDPQLQSKYLQTYHLFGIQIHQIQILFNNDFKNMLQKIFLEHFFPFCSNDQNFTLLDIEEPSLTQHFMEIRLNHNFQITQYQILLIYQLAKKAEEAQQIIMQYFQNVGLQRITSVPMIMKVYKAFFRCLCALSSGQKSAWRDQSKIGYKLAKLVLSFLQITQIFSEKTSSQQRKPTLKIARVQFFCVANETKGLSYLMLKQNDEAAFYLLKSIEQQSFASSPYYHLCKIYEQSYFLKQQTQVLVRQKIYQGFAQRARDSRNLQFVCLFSLAFRIIIRVVIQVRGHQAGYETLIDLLKAGNLQNTYFINLSAKPSIHHFLSCCDPPLLIHYLKQLISKQEAIKNPSLAILTYQMLHRVNQISSQVDPSCIKKAIIFAALGMSKINNLFLSQERRYLTIQIAKYFGKTNHQSIHKKLVHKTSCNFRNYIRKKFKQLINKRLKPIIIQKIQKSYSKMFACMQIKPLSQFYNL